MAASSLVFLRPLNVFSQYTGVNFLKTTNYIKGIKPQDKDEVVLVEGLRYSKLISWKDPISNSEQFGTNNDYTAFIPMDGKTNEAFLWVNHEYITPFEVSGRQFYSAPTQKQLDYERKQVGGSLLHISKTDGRWRLVKNSKYNRRLDARTMIPFANGVKVRGKTHAKGTFANCAGGVTPWKSLLTCEENYHNYYGEIKFKTRHNTRVKKKISAYNWEATEALDPEHYGWVVEVDPKTAKAKKHTSMGRFAHEGATVVTAADGRCVVYTGDDAEDEFIYKFIADKKNSLNTGKLYVANVDKGRWIELSYSKNKKLKKHFKNQLDVLTWCRKAGKIVGASPMNRPEGIAVHPDTNDVFISLTKNYSRNDFYGSILKIKERNADPLSLKFKASTFVAGGKASALSNPDNIIFDRKNNLWVANDISRDNMNEFPFSQFKNNGLFCIPTEGPQAGEVIQVASAPKDAEFTGPSFSADGKTLFLSVQHPGEKFNYNGGIQTSHWPDGGNKAPRSSVIAIQGEFFS